jgi:hypothetical protein
VGFPVRLPQGDACRNFERFEPSRLARLDALPDTAAWLLFYSNESIQRWFVSQGRPAGLHEPC